MKHFIIIFLLCPLWLAASNVNDFGAQGDGKTLNTEYNQKAIDQLSETGGGELFFPAGKYLTGTLKLKSHVTLRLSKGAMLSGSTDLKDYPVIEVGYVSHINRYTNRFLIYAENAENISITGEGTIDGQGDDPNFKADITDDLLGIRSRPYVIRMISCNHVYIAGITLRNSPSWMQHYLHCSNLRLENLQIFSHGNYNNDGMDIDNCRNVCITGCNIDTDDDGICFKSTNSGDACENVVVSNCIVASNCNAVKIGTETNGGFYNFTISNCVFRRPEHPTIYPRPHRALGGIAFSTADGATIDGINISNISMNGVMTPLFLHLADRGRNFYDGGPSQPPGTLRNIQITNIFARTEGLVAGSITGLPGHPVENITLSNIHFVSSGGGSLEDAMRRNIPEREKEYPETLKFSDVPAYGLFIRHAVGITMNNIHLEVLGADHRNALYAEDVKQLVLSGFTFSNPQQEAGLITLDNVQNAQISGNRSTGKNKYLIRIEGEHSSDIRQFDNQIADYKKVVYDTRLLKILLAGDSTMQDVDHDRSLDWGWGQVFSCFFNDSVSILNFAKGGRSTRTFIGEGLWDNLMAETAPGDYVFIQFGHNDASQKKTDRYTPPEQYRQFLEKFVRETLAKGANPILVTPVGRRIFKNGQLLANTHGLYPAVVKEVAAETGVPFIDLQEKSVRLIAQYGEEESKKMFVYVAPGESRLFPEGKADDTHFSRFGAMQMANLIVEGIKELQLTPLDRFLKNTDLQTYFTK
jgi:lysophospholipase L1-like esterase